MKHFPIIILSSLILFLFAITAKASDIQPEKPTDTNNKSVEALVAEINDQQARILLIEELKKKTTPEVKPNSEKVDTISFDRIIKRIRNQVTFVEERIDFLKSGGKSIAQQISGPIAYIGKGEIDSKPTRPISRILIIFVVAFCIELLFHWYIAPLKGRFKIDTPITLRGKIGRHFLRVFIDGVSILIFIGAAILCFYFFFDRTQVLRILLATYLTAIVATRISLIVSRLFLAPKDPYSRFLPITDANAMFLYRWITAISTFACFGLMTCGLIKLSGASDADRLKAIFFVALVIASMLITMILQKRNEVADVLSAKFPAKNQLTKLMNKWHHFAIFFVFILLLLSTGSIFLDNISGFMSIKTVLMIPLYFLMDWILCQILETLFGFIPKNEDAVGMEDVRDDVNTMPDEPQKKPKINPIEFYRMKKIIFSSLRFALIALFAIWVLNIWSIELHIGKAVVKVVFNILIVVLLCYVFWEFLNAIIQRRLKLEMPDVEEEMEEGGAGGSRIGTLLMLFRKFLMIFISVMAVMIILSAIGVDIGPLIAGAGIFGLAIGFGAQALVRDILSGVFFLIDDSFRLGDYIQVGAEKGTVERISIRSLSLRHPRGMVNTLPFGTISSVTNFSRDYIITKLDFRVRYDTDVEKVRKIIKKQVYNVILENEDLGPKLLGKIKSQGVRQMDDSAMVMRVKYKTIPGDQFAIRKEVYRLLQEAFKNEGIEFAHKNVTVYIPPETSQQLDPKDGESRKKIIEAAAASVLTEEATPQQTEK